jgi:hypothetical protein
MESTDQFTSTDVSKKLEIERSSAGQVLARMRRWGHIRVIGFKAPPGGIGRRLLIYEVTDHGKRANAWTKRNR